MVGFALLSSVGGVLAALRYGLPGFLVAVIFSYAAALLWAGGGSTPFVRPRWNLDALRELLRIGFPIMIAGALLITLWNVDKIAVWIFMSRESMGIYALGSYLVVSVMLVPEAVSVVLYPRLMEKSARVKEVGELQDFLTRPSLVLSYFASPVLGLLFLSFHLPIVWLLPRYTPTITPGKVLIAAIFFMVLTRMPQVVLVSLNRQKQLVALTVAAIVIAGGAVTGMILGGYGLVGVAWGAAAGYLAYSALTMVAAIRALEMPGVRAASFIASILAPYAIVFLAVALVLRFVPESEVGLGADITWTMLRCLFVVIGAGSLLWLLARRFGVLPLNRVRASEP
jgi:O-antigen/teichoic acid export membrane protein